MDIGTAAFREDGCPRDQNAPDGERADRRGNTNPVARDAGQPWKQRGVLNETQWVCAKTNYRTNKEAFNNIGETPEEAVQKVLEDRLGYTLDKL